MIDLSPYFLPLIGTSFLLFVAGVGWRKAAISLGLAPVSVLVVGILWLMVDVELGAGYGAGVEIVIFLLMGAVLFLFTVSNVLLWTLGRSIRNDAGKSWILLGLAGTSLIFAVAIQIVSISSRIVR